MIGLTIVIVILFFTLNYITDFLAEYISIFRMTSSLPVWMTTLSARNHYLLLFSWSWLFAIAAGVAYCFAKITEGWRVRTVIITILLLPLIINIISLTLPQIAAGGMVGELIFSLHGLVTYLFNPYFLPITSMGLLLIYFLYARDINGLFRLSFSLESQDERLIMTNLLRGLLYSISVLTFGMYIGLKNIILMTDFILVLPCVTLIFMNILAYLKESVYKS